MSVICGKSTYHLIDTSSPCRLIGAELSSARLPGRFLPLTTRAKRRPRKGRYGELASESEAGTLHSFHAGQLNIPTR